MFCKEHKGIKNARNIAGIVSICVRLICVVFHPIIPFRIKYAIIFAIMHESRESEGASEFAGHN